MEKNIAVVPVRDSLPFSWIGSESMLSRLLQTLDDIRDLDRVVVLAFDIEATKAEIPAQEHYSKPIQITRLNPSKVTFIDFIDTLKWYDENQTLKVVNYLFCDPLFPFLDRAKIEQALYSVLSGKDSAIMTQRGCNLSSKGLTPGLQISEACVAIKGSVLRRDVIAEVVSIGNYTEIPITKIEAVDCRHPCGSQIAQALESI